MRSAITFQQLEQLWADHLAGEFVTKDVEATLATMADDASVNHMAVNTGGRGKDELRVFYRDDFIPSWPEDLQITPVNRVVGDGQLGAYSPHCHAQPCGGRVLMTNAHLRPDAMPPA